MSAVIKDLPSGQVGSGGDEALQQVRQYWNNHIHDWKVAQSEVGSQAFFEEIEEYRFEKLNYLPRLVDFDGYRGKRVLDVGCGVGNDLARFAKGGAEVVGIDLAETSIDLARRNFRQRGLAGEFQIMNGERMDFPDDSFDLVYCHTVLHFTPHPERMVQEIHRVLRAGGHAIVMTVNRRSWLNLLHKVMKVEIDHLDAPKFHQFSAGEFRDLLSPFASVTIVAERFPVRTKVHGGLKARLYNRWFVDLFNALPRHWVRRSGHHLLAFAAKAAAAPVAAPPG
ncbi:MAG: ubiG 2 [Rhodospirillales bacterium]|jgi:2-polyprenyl-3-methyl-5-hydroxy-6-metoxy-1,4-benzoquinol methylase|nr:ubiG 2 [Geminicoccaceae bacterium]MDF2765351.1 ubiG 2 [Rhodospirillales bacterium]